MSECTLDEAVIGQCGTCERELLKLRADLRTAERRNAHLRAALGDIVEGFGDGRDLARAALKVEP